MLTTTPTAEPNERVDTGDHDGDPCDEVANDKYRATERAPLSGDDELRADNPRDWSGR